jgi:AraC family transcriptional regulator
MNSALRWTELSPGLRCWSNAASVHHRFEAGEGRFRFDELTVGLVLVTQPGHWGAYGSDRKRALPLVPGSGWVFPAGLDGQCSWQGPQAIVNVSLPKSLFADEGITDIEDFTVGQLDPLTAELIFALHAADETSPALYRESLTTALAAHLAQARIFEKRRLPPDHRILRAIDFIDAHLADDLSLATLASVAALSPYHFLRRFKAETGRSPHVYVTVKRMERAKLLIETTRRPIADIAWSLGFGDASRFAQLFKRYIGAAPGDLRKARLA